jgi:hypothetical protein
MAWNACFSFKRRTSFYFGWVKPKRFARRSREEAERFWNIRPLVNTPPKGTKNLGVSKPIKSKKTA